MKQYMVTKPGGIPEGPFDEATLTEKIKQGLYTANDYVWEESLPKWEPLSKHFPIPDSAANGGKRPPLPHETLLGVSKETIAFVSQSVRDNLNKENLKKYADKTNQALKDATGLRVPDTFSFKVFFKDMFRAHAYQEFVALFSRGTATTTPELQSINVTWPSPWAFSRMLIICIVAFAAIAWGVQHYDNMNLSPAFLFLGTFSVPFCIVVFFYEMNIKQDIPFFEVLKAFIWGGVLSMLFSLFLFEKSGADAPYWAGCIEEPGKLLAAIIMAQAAYRKGNVLHGLLIGCAVGAGFAAFETAGYVYRYMAIWADIDNLRHLVQLGVITTPQDAVKYIISISQHNQIGIISDERQAYALCDIFAKVNTDEVIAWLKGLVDFNDVMLLRAAYTPFCHVIWTAITAGAFWHALSAVPPGKSHYVNLELLRDRCTFGLYSLYKKMMKSKDEQGEEDKIDLAAFLNPRFYVVALIPVLLHMFWNSSLLASFGLIRNLSIGVASWFLALALIQVGINQVKAEKERRLCTSPDERSDAHSETPDASAAPANGNEETKSTKD